MSFNPNSIPDFNDKQAAEATADRDRIMNKIAAAARDGVDPQSQAALDRWLSAHSEARIDYIHGEAALRGLIDRPDALGLMPRPFDKSELFDAIRRHGVLPRKTFSMGEATEKRYYMEARGIQ